MKKVIAFVCALSMMTAVVSQNIGCDYNIGDGHKVFAAVNESEFEYEELEDGTVEITGYSGEDTVLVIPDEIDGKRVTSIGNCAFFVCIGLKEITIPEGVTSIGDYAFSECRGLKEITIPEGVTSIGNSAFEGCSSLTEITIPEGATSIGEGAFFGTPWLKNKQSDNPMVIVNGILIDGTECKGSVVVP